MYARPAVRAILCLAVASCSQCGEPEPAACTAGENRSCFNGPPERAQVGACRSGTQECLDDESGFGPCEGEVLPRAETCKVPEDEDCDGLVDEEGDGCTCTAGVTEACYDGPPGTEGVGVCVAGTRTCLDAGAGWSPCSGGFQPVEHDCCEIEDADCDGEVGCPDSLYANAYETGIAIVGGVDTDSELGYAIVGRAHTPGPLDFGAGAVPIGAYVAKLSAAGCHRWTRSIQIGAATGQYSMAEDVAFSSAGDVLVVGSYNLSVDLGLGVVSCDQASACVMDGFVAKYRTTGEPIWAKTSAGEGSRAVTSVAAHASGDVVFAGIYGLTIDFGCGLTEGPDGVDFVAKLGSTGVCHWMRSAQGSANDAVGLFSLAGSSLYPRVAVAPDGSVLLAYTFTGTRDWGGTPLVSAGGGDVILAKLDPRGDLVFAERFGDAEDQRAHAVAVDAQGFIVVAGEFVGTLDIGLGPAPAGAGSSLFVAKFDPSGAPVWLRTFPMAQAYGTLEGVDHTHDVDVDAEGNIVVACGFRGQIDFGSGPLPDAALCAAKLDPSGSVIWAKAFGGFPWGPGPRVAVDASGRTVLAGMDDSGPAFAPLDFGYGPLASSDQTIFVARLAP